MMNNTNTSPKITVSKTSPWVVSVNGEAHSTYPTRTAARTAAKRMLPLADGPTPEVVLHDVTGAILEGLRRERKISLKSIAQVMGTTPYQVWYTEKGKLPVTADYVRKFDAALATA